MTEKRAQTFLAILTIIAVILVAIGSPTWAQDTFKIEKVENDGLIHWQFTESTPTWHKIQQNDRDIELYTKGDANFLMGKLQRAFSDMDVFTVSKSAANVINLAVASPYEIIEARSSPKIAAIALRPILQKVQLRTGKHPDFVRLAIEASDPASIQINQNGDEITVSSTTNMEWEKVKDLRDDLQGLEVTEISASQLRLAFAPRASVRLIDDRIWIIDFPLAAPSQSLDASPPANKVQAPNKLSKELEGRVELAAQEPNIQSPEPLATVFGPPAPPEPQLSRLEPPMRIIAVEELIIDGKRNDGETFLEFTWGTQVPLAAFWRGNRLFVIGGVEVNQIRPVSREFQQEFGATIRKLEQIGHPTATVLAIDFSERIATHARSGQTGWKIVLGEPNGGPDGSEVSRIDFTPQGLTLSTGVGSIGFDDPIVGDRISAIMSHHPHPIPIHETQTVDFMLMESTVGLGMVGHSQELTEFRDDHGLGFTRDNGLRVYSSRPSDSPISVDRPTESELASTNPGSPNDAGDAGEPTDRSPEAIDEPNTAVDRIAEPIDESDGLALVTMRRLAMQPLRTALRATAHSDRIQNALAKARTHLAFAMPSEALTWIEVASRAIKQNSQNPDEAVRVTGKILRAVAKNIFAPGDPDVLFDPDFDTDPEIEAWRLIAEVRNGQWQYMPEQLARVREILDRYPKRLQIDMNLEIVEALVELGQIDAAFALIDYLERLEGSDAQRATLLHAKGLGFAFDGDLRRGLELIDQALAIADDVQGQEIAIDKLRLQLDAEIVAPSTALAELDAKLPFWRGLRNEPELLTFLGDLALRSGRLNKALATWRRAADRAVEDNEDIVARMRRHFVDFVGRNGWQRSPFAALEVLRRYKELVPQDQKG